MEVSSRDRGNGPNSQLITIIQKTQFLPLPVDCAVGKFECSSIAYFFSILYLTLYNNMLVPNQYILLNNYGSELELHFLQIESVREKYCSACMPLKESILSWNNILVLSNSSYFHWYISTQASIRTKTEFKEESSLKLTEHSSVFARR